MNVTSLEREGIQMVANHPTEYNRIVPARYSERETPELNALGPVETREAVLLYNEQTMLTAEKTIEYII